MMKNLLTLLLLTSLSISLTAQVAPVKPVRPVAPTPPSGAEPTAPPAPLTPLPPLTEISEHSTQVDNKGDATWTITANGTTFKLNQKGEVTLSDDDKDITAISEGGYFVLSKTVFGSRYKVEIREKDGKLIKKFYQGGSEKPWEPAGREWLAEVLPDLVRSTTLGAESRVKRFYQKGGYAAVLAEVGEIKSDHIRSHYGKLLLKQPLNEIQQGDAVKQLSKLIRSDYYLADFLTGNLRKGTGSKTMAQALVNAAAEINSDYYRASVLESAIKKELLQQVDVKQFLSIATGIGSDYYKASVLEAMADNADMNAHQVQYFQSAGSISSDYYRAAVLTDGLAQFRLTTTGLQQGMAAWSDMSSDYYKQAVMIKMLHVHKLTPDAQKLVLQPVAAGMSSGLYKSDVLRTYARTQRLTEENFPEWAQAVSTVNSDYYMASAFNSLSPDNLSGGQLAALMKNAAKISSDYYKSEVLRRYAAAVAASTAEAKDAFKAAAKTISSTHYFGEVMRSID